MKPLQIPVNPKVLVAPLDWGLGHATRCIPLINTLLLEKCSVYLAGSGKIRSLLQGNFPELPFLELKGYGISYGRSKASTLISMVLQTPNIFKSIRHEHVWLEKQQEKHGFDLIFSDNRYGLYHEKIPSVLLTHQLALKSSFSRVADRIIHKKIASLIDNFSECWVPDLEEPPGLSGALGHPATTLLKIPVRYTGALSRFSSKPIAATTQELLFLISGPEPQRTIWEAKVMKALSNYHGKSTVVRGLPDGGQQPTQMGNITIYDHLPVNELEMKIKTAAYIISRCGYSTVMDLFITGKKSILVPTPGQAEQEYLAQHLMQRQFCYSVKQKDFSLHEALAAAQSFPYLLPKAQENNLQVLVKNIMEKRSAQ